MIIEELSGAVPPAWQDIYIWVSGWHAEAQHAGTQHVLGHTYLGEAQLSLDDA